MFLTLGSITCKLMRFLFLIDLVTCSYVINSVTDSALLLLFWGVDKGWKLLACLHFIINTKHCLWDWNRHEELFLFGMCQLAKWIFQIGLLFFFFNRGWLEETILTSTHVSCFHFFLKAKARFIFSMHYSCYIHMLFKQHIVSFFYFF